MHEFEQINPSVRRLAVPCGYLYQLSIHDQNANVWSAPVFVADFDALLKRQIEMASTQTKDLIKMLDSPLFEAS